MNFDILQQSLRIQERKLTENQDKMYNKQARQVDMFKNLNIFYHNIRQLFNQVPLDEEVVFSQEQYFHIVNSVQKHLNTYEKIVESHYVELMKSKIIADLNSQIAALNKLQEESLKVFFIYESLINQSIQATFETPITDSTGNILNSNIKKKQIQDVEEDGFNLVDHVEFQKDDIEVQTEQPQQIQQLGNQKSDISLIQKGQKAQENVILLLKNTSFLQQGLINMKLNSSDSQLIIADIFLQLYCLEFKRNSEKYNKSLQQYEEQLEEYLKAILQFSRGNMINHVI